MNRYRYIHTYIRIEECSNSELLCSLNKFSTMEWINLFSPRYYAKVNLWNEMCEITNRKIFEIMSCYYCVHKLISVYWFCTWNDFKFEIFQIQQLLFTHNKYRFASNMWTHYTECSSNWSKLTNRSHHTEGHQEGYALMQGGLFRS